jgi:phthalate 4,5-dioxygenase oxygenase subunit
MGIGNFKWLQAVETTMDSSHLGILHQTAIKSIGDVGITKDYTAPVYELDRKPYGFRYASIRAMADGNAYVRVNTFVTPWFAFISPTINRSPGYAIQMNVPVDDEHTIFFLLEFRRPGINPAEVPLLQQCADPSNFPPPVPGGPHNNWGQDRNAMKNGHFTGFPQHLLTEDLAVNTSMKPVVDRSKETLNIADMAIVNVRRCILEAVQEFVDGEAPHCTLPGAIDYAEAIPMSDVIGGDVAWREYFSPAKAGI